jgi:hypothetical protein
VGGGGQPPAGWPRLQPVGAVAAVAATVVAGSALSEGVERGAGARARRRFKDQGAQQRSAAALQQQVGSTPSRGQQARRQQQGSTNAPVSPLLVAAAPLLRIARLLHTARYLAARLRLQHLQPPSSRRHSCNGRIRTQCGGPPAAAPSAPHRHLLAAPAPGPPAFLPSRGGRDGRSPNTVHDSRHRARCAAAAAHGRPRPLAGSGWAARHR